MARSQARGTSTAGSMGGKSKDGMSAVSGQHQCNHKKGMQYYRDLAGNVKQVSLLLERKDLCIIAAMILSSL